MPAEPLFIAPPWLDVVSEEIGKLRSTREREFASLTDTFGDPEELARCYVQPKCQHANPADEHEEEPSSEVRSPVFDTLNLFLTKKFVTKPNGRNQLFVLSDAGMGKTSILVMLKLMQLNALWPPDHECVLLRLSVETLEQIATIQARGKTTLLLDALDEDPEAWGRLDDRLRELLVETDSFRRVIISCRTQFFPESGSDPFKNRGRITIGGRVCPLIYLSPFEDEHIKEYLTKRFPDTWLEKLVRIRNERARKSEDIVLSMESLRFRPLVLAHIEDILDSDASLVWNEYTTYEAVLRAWLMREEGKPGARVEAKKLYAACASVAEEMQVSGRRHFSRKRLETLLAEQDLEQISYLEFGGRSLLARNSKGQYRFSHYTIQEFLIAHGVLNASLRHGTAAFRNTDQIARFVALGILADVVPVDVTLVASFIGSVSDPGLLRKVSKKLGWDSYAVIAGAVKASADEINGMIDASDPPTPGDLIILDALSEARQRNVAVAVVSWGIVDNRWLVEVQARGLTFSSELGKGKSAWFNISGGCVGWNGVKGLYEIDQHRLVQRAPVETVQ
jgi:hypothetical protein